MVLTEDLRRKRLLLEFKYMLDSEPTFACLDKNLMRYLGVITGSGLYADGYFIAELILTSGYPYHPPIVVWYTPTWHPNIPPPKSVLPHSVKAIKYRIFRFLKILKK